jgi:hypothetical protein
MRQLVELEKVHPDVGTSHQRRQHLGDEPPSRSHLLDLGRRSILDHPEIVPYAIQPHSLEQYVLSSLNHSPSVNWLLLYLACSRCTWHARRVQREPPARKGMDATIR